MKGIKILLVMVIIVIISILITKHIEDPKSELKYNLNESTHITFEIVDDDIFIHNSLSITNSNNVDYTFKVTEKGTIEEGLVLDDILKGYNTNNLEEDTFIIESNSTTKFDITFIGSIGEKKQRKDREPPITINLEIIN